MALGTTWSDAAAQPLGSEYVAIAEFDVSTHTVTGTWEKAPLVSDFEIAFDDAAGASASKIELTYDSGRKLSFDDSCGSCGGGGSSCCTQTGTFTLTTFQRDAPTMNIHEQLCGKTWAIIKLGSCGQVDGKTQWTAAVGSFVNPGTNKHKGISKAIKFKGVTHTAAVTISSSGAASLGFVGVGCATVNPPDVVIPCGNFTTTVDV